MNITTILQIYKRPNYLKEQMVAIDEQTIKSDRIFIVHNEGNIKFEIPKRVDTQYIYISPNMKFHPRFAIGLLTDAEYIFFFDDDTIPGKNLFKNAIDLINKHDCIVVGNGRVIQLEDKRWNCLGWGNPSDKEIECDFGGHFWGMKKEFLKYMWYENPITYTNCEDMMLSFNCFRFSGIKTFVIPHPAFDKTMWSSLKGNEFGSDEVASWVVNPTHFQERWNTIFEYVNRGYVPLLKRKI